MKTFLMNCQLHQRESTSLMTNQHKELDHRDLEYRTAELLKIEYPIISPKYRMSQIQIDARILLTTLHLGPIEYEMRMSIDEYILLKQNNNFIRLIITKFYQTLKAKIIKTDESIRKTSN